VEGSLGGGIDISNLSARGSGNGTFSILSVRGIGKQLGEPGREDMVME
jgi:hypothetical protein